LSPQSTTHRNRRNDERSEIVVIQVVNFNLSGNSDADYRSVCDGAT
jgi:hypothetical protein